MGAGGGGSSGIVFMHFRYAVAMSPFYSSGGDLFLVYGKTSRWWTLGGGGVVVSYDNVVS